MDYYNNHRIEYVGTWTTIIPKRIDITTIPKRIECGSRITTIPKCIEYVGMEYVGTWTTTITKRI